MTDDPDQVPPEQIPPDPTPDDATHVRPLVGLDDSTHVRPQAAVPGNPGTTEPGATAAPQRTSTVTRRGVAKNLVVVAIFLVFTLVVGVAFAYFGGTSIPGGGGAAAATSVNQGPTPTVVAGDGSVTVSWAASTLATGAAASGYLVKRYDASSLVAQTVLTSCAGTITATTCTESNLATGSWRYAVTPTFATSWQGPESAKSAVVATVEKDVAPPVNALTTTQAVGSIYQSGNTVYYKGSAAGSFALRNTLVDASSGPASSTTQALSGTATGWSHTPSTVSTPTGGPYVSNPFSWTAGTTSTPAEAVVGKDVKGNAATTTLTFTNDSTAPTATVGYGNTFEVGRSVAVTFTASDAGSGVSSRQLQRSSAPITGGVCGTYSSFNRIGPANPTSPYTDSQVTNGSCYKYRYVVTDNVGNQTIGTSTNVTKVDYQGAVSASTGLLSQWRLGEKLVVSDSFVGTAGAALSSRAGDTGATWTRWVNDTAGSAVFTDANRLRRNAVGGVTYLASGVPPVADYQVAVDVTRKSSIAGDYAGVLGRVTSDTTGQGTRYNARYNSDGATWELLKVVSGTATILGTSAQTLTIGQSYRLSLDMRGTTIRLLVDGVERVSVTDSTITGTGLVGLRLGAGTTGAASTNTTGLHVDDFRVTPRALDGKGSNNGTYVDQPLLGVAGAITGDPDTAVVFDGTRDAMQVANTTGVPVGASVRSVEAWFKTVSAARQTILSYGARNTGQEFGLMVDAASSIRAWGLGSDQTFSTPYAVNDGAWHQVIETFDGSTMTIYLDGVALPTQAATRSTGLDTYGIGIGAVLVPGDSFSGSYFTGTLDEVSFYTTVLTAATVSNHYALGSSPVPDVTGPTGGSVDADGLVGTGSRYSTSTALSLELATGTDPSGVSPDGAELQRATATLTSSGGTANGVCGSYGAYSVISGGTDPDSPASDTVTDQACYSYHYVVPDTLGNLTTYASGDVKVEGTAPAAPTLTFSALTNAYAGSGSTVYYNPAASTGSFTVTAAATDTKSGIAGYAFPSLGSGWTSTPGATGVNRYSWSGVPAAPASPAVTATNNATGVSPGAAFTPTIDNTAPSAGTVSYPAVSHTTSVSVAFTAGTDGGSGVGSRVLQRATATLTGGSCGTFSAFTTVTGGTNPTSPLANTVAFGSCYTYQYVVTDNVGNKTTASSATVLQVTSAYADTVQATSGLVNYWRLDEQADQVDGFTGTAGTTLPAHTADSKVTWTTYAASVGTVAGVLTDQGRLRKNAISGGVGYYTSQVPSSPDYRVEADVVVKSQAANNAVGVLGRVVVTASGTGTYYIARYDISAVQWQLIRNVNGNAFVLGTFGQGVATGSSYRVGLDMAGSTIRLLVDGTQRISATDSTLTAAGRPGVALGSPGDNAVQSDAIGLQLDNFRVVEALQDSKGSAEGSYVNGPTLGVDGAIPGDDDTAAGFDGVNDYGTVPRQVADDLSIEFWFSSTQGLGTGGQWWEGAGMVDAEVNGNANDFGVSLRSDGRVVAGVGGIGASDVSIVSSTAGFNDGGWHHVVFTRVRASGAIRLYVDGDLMGSATGSTNALDSQPTLSFGQLASVASPYAGRLDEISVYNVALSAATVSGHYLSGS